MSTGMDSSHTTCWNLRVCDGLSFPNHSVWTSRCCLKTVNIFAVSAPTNLTLRKDDKTEHGVHQAMISGRNVVNIFPSRCGCWTRKGSSLLWNIESRKKILFILILANDLMKCKTGAFITWSQWETFTNWTLMKMMSGQSCLRVSSDLWGPGLLHRMVPCLDTDLSSTMTPSSWMRKEYLWLLPSLPLWLQKNHQAWSMTAPGRRRSNCIALLNTWQLAPLLSREH
ncbi:uncharacterized protein LOC115904779 [Camarhynchus parvulus]|uniref:uncharacterized protein LOC115904779 n=1 Tax=Geospiza parvula TaxID=87175 RepID=UPI001237F33B|nr:uncharacterized protein LOC115904779 [Camarhynchus parvulus]